MAKLFGKNQQNQMNERQLYERGYNSACGSLLLLIILTVVNGFLLVVNSNTYFLFTAWVPYLLLDMGMYLCGKYPVEYYDGNIGDYNFMNNGVLAFFIGAALIIVLLYVLCWHTAKKGKIGGLIAGLVFLLVDTVMMFVWAGFTADNIMDIVVRACMIISVIGGISGYYKLKKLTEEKPIQPIEQPIFDQNNGFNYNDTDDRGTM